MNSKLMGQAIVPPQCNIIPKINAWKKPQIFLAGLLNPENPKTKSIPASR
jgi:hypothetical protein